MTLLGKAAILSLSLPVALGAAVASADDVRVEGKIREVSEEDRSLTVELTETGAIQTFRIDESTEVSFENTSRPVRTLHDGFDDLRAGQSVTLRFDDEELVDNWVLLRIIEIS